MCSKVLGYYSIENTAKTSVLDRLYAQKRVNYGLFFWNTTLKNNVKDKVFELFSWTKKLAVWAATPREAGWIQNASARLPSKRFNTDMSNAHLASPFFERMPQKYCTCQEKHQQRHMKSCNCHAGCISRLRLLQHKSCSHAMRVWDLK